MVTKTRKEEMRIEGAKGEEYFILVKKISPRKSASGKSMLLVSTNGREAFTHEGREIQVNLNAYSLIPKDKR